jgi:transposase-like protein
MTERSMANQQIQFQPGVSIPEFLSRFGTEAQCAVAVKLARWPDGFVCPRCACTGHYVVGHGARKLFQCTGCRHQTSLTSGSLMEHTKLPLTTWFLAIYLISQAKTGLSALALKRQLGVSYPTAWLLHHKINHAMAEQDRCDVLGGTVQLDDAYLGGERSGGKVGRGSENKVPFLAAVSVNAEGHPLYLKLNRVSGFTSEAIGHWARACLLPATVVISDGLGCFAAVTDAGCIHAPQVVGNRKPRDLPEFKWVNTVLGNLKTTLAGAFHALKYRKYGEHYLAAFAYRFNRRFDLCGLLANLIADVARTPPVDEKRIRVGQAEAHF